MLVQNFKSNQEYNEYKNLIPNITFNQHQQLLKLLENHIHLIKETQINQYKRSSEQISLSQIMVDKAKYQNLQLNEIILQNIQTKPNYTKEYCQNYIKYTRVRVKSTFHTKECIQTMLLDSQFNIYNPLTKIYLNLNPVQTAVFQHLLKQDKMQNLIITAPTSTGKTLCSCLVILKLINQILNELNISCIDDYNNIFKKNIQYLTVYTAPTRSLCSQIHETLNVYFDCFKNNIQMLTSDQQNEQLNDNTMILITTYEKLDVLLNNNQQLKQNVKLIVFDEIHQLNDQSRGFTIENIIMKIKYMNKQDSSSNINILGLSATVSNIQEVSQFLEAEYLQFDEQYRQVQLKMQFFNFVDKQNFYMIKVKKQQELLNLVKSFLNDKQQVIIFCGSKSQTIQLAIYLAENIQTQLNQTIQQENENHLLNTLISNQVAYHNAGMNKDERTAVEQFFIQGKIKILIATATLAQGINLPARNVIIYETQYYDQNINQFINMSNQELYQMAGRAGRPQYDKDGDCYVFVNNNENIVLKYLENDNYVESKVYLKLFQNFCDFCLLNSYLNCKNNTELYLKYLQSSLFYQQNVLKFNFSQISKNIIQVSQQLNLIEIFSEHIHQTQIATLSSKYYVQPEVIIFQNNFTKIQKTINLNNNQMQDYLLQLIFRSDEFRNIRIHDHEFHILRSIDNYAKFKFIINQIIKPNEHQRILNSMSIIGREITVQDILLVKQNLSRILSCLLDVCCLNKNVSLLMQIVKLIQVTNTNTVQVANINDTLKLFQKIINDDQYIEHQNIKYISTAEFFDAGFHVLLQDFNIVEQIMCLPQNLNYIQKYNNNLFNMLYTSYQQLLIQQIPSVIIEYGDIYIQPLNQQDIFLKFYYTISEIDNSLLKSQQLFIFVVIDGQLIQFTNNTTSNNQEQNTQIKFQYNNQQELLLLFKFSICGFEQYLKIDISKLSYLHGLSKTMETYKKINQDEITQNSRHNLLIVDDNTDLLNQVLQQNKMSVITISNNKDPNNYHYYEDFHKLLTIIKSEQQLLLVFIDIQDLDNDKYGIFVEYLLILAIQSQHQKIYLISDNYFNMNSISSFLQVQDEHIMNNKDSAIINNFLESKMDIQLILLTAALLEHTNQIDLNDLLNQIQNSYFLIRMYDNPYYYNFLEFDVTNKYLNNTNDSKIIIKDEDANNFINNLLQQIVIEIGENKFIL